MHDGADVLKTMRQIDIAGSIRRLEKNRLFRNPKLLACTSEQKTGQRSTVDYYLEAKNYLQVQAKLIIANIFSKATVIHHGQRQGKATHCFHKKMKQILQTVNKFLKDHHEVMMSVLLKRKEFQYAKLLLYYY
jgi:hypothetical protein